MKQIDILGKLFGSNARVKLLKFFLLNDETAYALDDISKLLRVAGPVLRPELKLLITLGFIKTRNVTQVIVGKRKTTKKKVVGYIALKNFPLIDPLRNLIVETGGIRLVDIAPRLASAGKITLFIASGIFMKDPERMADLIIVGDKLEKSVLESEIGKLESEIGRELRYALFDSEEFLYRLKMYDKLIRDILDYPHEKIINKLSHPDLVG
jgi:hypothetical protein